MSKAAKDSIPNDTIIKNGLRFRDGNTSFCVMEPVDGEPGKWHVRCSVPGAGFFRTKPNISTMSEERILKLVSEEKGDQAAKGMNTIGTRAGERLRARNTKERFTPRFDGFYQGRAAARA